MGHRREGGRGAAPLAHALGGRRAVRTGFLFLLRLVRGVSANQLLVSLKRRSGIKDGKYQSAPSSMGTKHGTGRDGVAGKGSSGQVELCYCPQDQGVQQGVDQRGASKAWELRLSHHTVRVGS